VILNLFRLGLASALLAASIFAGDSANERNETPKLIAPAKSLGTGLPFLPDLDLSKFTTDEFVRLSSSVGTNRIRKSWTSPCVMLPPHARKDPHGLTLDEVKEYMAQARQLFDDGKAIPVSDTGLISSQEDVIRRPMLNHISAFSNEVARVYLLVQKSSNEKGWGYFSIVEDLTAKPPIDYFADLNGRIRFEGKSCYKCHSSGPLAIHPAREDLVMDPALAAAVSRQIAKQPMADFYWPTNEVKPNYGEPLKLEFCAECHDATDGVRQPLYRVHSHPMRVYVDYGYMPPKHHLNPDQIAQLKAWLDEKP
jgi:hypothetical protein